MLGGEKDFYQKMLLKFVSKQSGVVENISELLRARQWDEAQRVVHNLKSVSGSRGAESLFEIVKQLERRIKERKIKDIEAALNPLKIASEPIFQQVNQFLEKKDES